MLYIWQLFSLCNFSGVMFRTPINICYVVHLSIDLTQSNRFSLCQQFLTYQTYSKVRSSKRDSNFGCMTLSKTVMKIL